MTGYFVAVITSLPFRIWGRKSRGFVGRVSALRVHDAFKSRAILSLPEARRRTGLSFPAVSAAVARLETLGIVREITGRKRGRIYVYERYLTKLNEGTE